MLCRFGGCFGRLAHRLHTESSHESPPGCRGLCENDRSRSISAAHTQRAGESVQRFFFGERAENAVQETLDTDEILCGGRLLEFHGKAPLEARHWPSVTEGPLIEEL